MVEMTFKYERHNQIWQTLCRADLNLLAENKAFFAGGTCIALFYGEHRESEDIDFLCDVEHYGAFRNMVAQRGLACVFPGAQPDMRVDRYGIRGRVDGVRLEILLEARAPVFGAVHDSGMLVAAPECLMAEKLLANSDRWMDAAYLHKDMIDLAAVYIKSPDSLGHAYEMAHGAYKDSVSRDFSSALQRFAKPEIRKEIAAKFKMNPEVLAQMLPCLVQIRNAIQHFDADKENSAPCP